MTLDSKPKKLVLMFVYNGGTELDFIGAMVAFSAISVDSSENPSKYQ